MLSWLLKTGSMAQSLGVYLPATLIQKALGLVRVFLFVMLMEQVAPQYGLWSAAIMLIFDIGSQLATLGANHGLTRYASVYEARGELWPFYRRVLAGSAVVALAMVAVGILSAGPIARYIVAGKSDALQMPAEDVYRVTVLALANALGGALYYNLVGLMMGLRVYRLVAVVELTFSVLLTAIGCSVLLVTPTAAALLGAHLGALGSTVVIAWIVLHLGLRRQTGGANDDWTACQTLGALWQLGRFGLMAMVGGLAWLAVQRVSLYLVNQNFDKADLGVFGFFLQLSQPVFMLSSAAWVVMFAHVARQWEQESQAAATQMLETVYKAVVLATMALAVTIYVTAPWWSLVVPDRFRTGLGLLGGLLMFYQCMGNLALVTMLAKLRERPGVIVWVALAGGVANALLARWWMPGYGAVGAAWAAGAGMLLGGGAVATASMMWRGPRLHAGTYLMMASPAVLAMPAWAAAAAWAAVLVVAVRTHQVFSAPQKQILLSVWRRVRGQMPWR